MLDVLERYRSDSLMLEAKYQYFVAEVIMLRLFSILEQSIAEIAYKIVAGASYLNGNSPILLTSARNVAGAKTLLLTYGRRKPVQNLKFTKSKFIRDSVRYVINASDAFVVKSQWHGARIDEMRKVRNHLAHRNTSTRKEYNKVVRSIYGANLRIQTGPFLVSTKRRVPANIDRYIGEVRIIMHDLMNG